MAGFKFIVQKNDIADDTKAIREDTKFIGIAEMPVDILLFCIRTGSGLGGHKPIGHFIRVNLRIIFIVGFEFFDEGIQRFGIVFSDKKFNAGGVKRKDLDQRRINELADRFGKINHLLEHKLNEGLKILSEPGKKRGIGDFGEAAEIAHFLADGKDKDEKRVRGDGKNLLKDESGKESGQWVKAFSAKMLIESTGKNRRDEILNIKMFIKELEERRGIINKHVLAV